MLQGPLDSCAWPAGSHLLRVNHGSCRVERHFARGNSCPLQTKLQGRSCWGYMQLMANNSGQMTAARHTTAASNEVLYCIAQLTSHYPGDCMVSCYCRCHDQHEVWQGIWLTSGIVSCCHSHSHNKPTSIELPCTPLCPFLQSLSGTKPICNACRQ